MARTTRIRRITAALVAVAGATGLALSAGTGTASADRSYPLSGCFGLSPNIVDTPYNPLGVSVGRYGGFTTVYTTYSSLWLGIGYDSAARFDWHNLNTGKRGVQFSNSATRPPTTGTHGFSIPDRTIGNGRVKITLSTVNRNALWAIPAQTCSTTITLP